MNNITYTRWAESARVNWVWNFAKHVDPENRNLWAELWTSRGAGLILKSIQIDYKFAGLPSWSGRLGTNGVIARRVARQSNGLSQTF